MYALSIAKTESLYKKSPYRPLLADRGFDVFKAVNLFAQPAA